MISRASNVSRVPGGRLLIWIVSVPQLSHQYASPFSGGRMRM